MSLPSDVHRVSRRYPCPTCEHSDWCCIGGPVEDPHTSFCCRIESGHRAGDLGWIHRLRDEVERRRQVHPSATVVSTDYRHWERQTEAFAAALDPKRLGAIADGLGVASASLRRLDIGWEGSAFAWPMRDGVGRPVGIRLRRPNGFKYAVAGSRNGLFLADELDLSGRIWLTEGPTDTAALLGLGLPAVGRPDCHGGGEYLCDLVRRARPTSVVLVADSDGPGQLGAKSLAAVLRCFARDVRWIVPPLTDLDARDWVRSGAQADDFEQLADQAESVALTLAAATGGGK